MPRTPRHVSLHLETLEDRRLMAINLVGGNIQIDGTPVHDGVTVWDATLNGVPGYLVSNIWTQPGARGVEKRFFRFTEVTGDRIIFNGREGNDTFQYVTSYGKVLKVIANGGAGNDTIKGYHADDVLMGGSGADHMFGGRGNDMLMGSSTLDVDGRYDPLDGNNVLRGGGGSDALFGGNGIDLLYGCGDNGLAYDGNDYLDGGKDYMRDHLHGAKGSDTFVVEWNEPLGKILDLVADFETGKDKREIVFW